MGFSWIHLEIHLEIDWPLVFSYALSSILLETACLESPNLQICVTPIGNSNVKNQDPWKFHIVIHSLSWTHLEAPLLFYLTSGISTCSFFNTSGNSMSWTPLFSRIAHNILQNCGSPLGNSNVKNQDPWKFHMAESFLNISENSTSFLINLFHV